MAKIEIEGRVPPTRSQELDPAQVCVNTGLNYGRFFGPRLPYRFTASKRETLEVLGAAYIELVEEMREDDLLDDEPSPLAAMGYPPSLDEAFEQPAGLAEVIATFFDRELMAALCGDPAPGRLVINSTARVFVAGEQVTIEGECFEQRTRPGTET